MAEEDNTSNIRRILEEWDFTDTPIMRHGFLPYNRDFEIVIAAPRAFIHEPASDETTHYRFVGCVYARYESSVLPQAFSLDDRLIDFAAWETSGNPEGFVWGVNWIDAWPGLKYIEDSPLAQQWSDTLGLTMHEVTIDTNTFVISLVFHDIVVSRRGS